MSLRLWSLLMISREHSLFHFLRVIHNPWISSRIELLIYLLGYFVVGHLTLQIYCTKKIQEYKIFKILENIKSIKTNLIPQMWLYFSLMPVQNKRALPLKWHLVEPVWVKAVLIFKAALAIANLKGYEVTRRKVTKRAAFQQAPLRNHNLHASCDLNICRVLLTL